MVWGRCETGLKRDRMCLDGRGNVERKHGVDSKLRHIKKSFSRDGARI
jgi:hypothetical protein